MKPITNQRQRRIAETNLREFRHTAEALRANPTRPVRRHQLEIDTADTLAAELEAAIADYDQLAGATAITIENVQDLGAALIRARCAAQLTQADLAKRTGINHRTIQRYEATNYQTANLTRFATIAEALGLDLDGNLTRTR